jgi:hypothetical protein
VVKRVKALTALSIQQVIKNRQMEAHVRPKLTTRALDDAFEKERINADADPCIRALALEEAGTESTRATLELSSARKGLCSYVRAMCLNLSGPEDIRALSPKPLTDPQFGGTRDLLRKQVAIQVRLKLGEPGASWVEEAAENASRDADSFLKHLRVCEVPSDGSCMFHAFLAGISRDYRQASEDVQGDVGRAFRHSFLAGTDLEAIGEYCRPRAGEGERVGRCGDVAVLYDLLSSNKYATDTILQFLSERFHVNVFVITYSSQAGAGGYLGCSLVGNELKRPWPCILLFNDLESHFRPVCFVNTPSPTFLFSSPNANKIAFTALFQHCIL